MQLWLIPLLPFTGFLINGIFGRRFPKSLINTVAIGSVVLAFAWVLKTIAGMGDLNSSVTEHYFTWIQSGSVNIGCDFFVDRLTIVMITHDPGIATQCRRTIRLHDGELVSDETLAPLLPKRSVAS